MKWFALALGVAWLAVAAISGAPDWAIALCISLGCIVGAFAIALSS